LGDGPIGNLRERLETEVGLRVFYFAMPSKIAGVFAFNEDLGACIGINAKHPRDRRQWSLAHEYGHFLMHRYHPEITILLERRLNSAKERVTDSFAENFLMPAAGLNRRFTEIHRACPKGATLGDIVSLANLYQVSVQALVLRLESLKRLVPGTWDRLITEGFEVQKAQHLIGIDANQPVRDLFPQRYVSLSTRVFSSRIPAFRQMRSGSPADTPSWYGCAICRTFAGGYWTIFRMKRSGESYRKRWSSVPVS
jgi:Zn-dependent peptidase ImmA (M78 family)